ncbi:hypothetical protein AAES_63863 [Amazona aestiva]|uniref:Uncharacterized protein n=1 Tax=Amazona aestiva TaxID=12930 RepID=A0A0Q3MKM2_AMAAE|nr:hypothetical protein AAES_63863 [Amazona aestiva]
MNVVYEVLEASIPIDSKEKLAEWPSLALDPETRQVGDTDGENLIAMTIPDWIEKLMTGENYVVAFSIIFDIPRTGETP